MIKIFGALFWQIVIDHLAGPAGADRPTLILIVEHTEADNAFPVA